MKTAARRGWGYKLLLTGFLLVSGCFLANAEGPNPIPVRVVVKPTNAFATDNYYINKNKIIDSLTNALLRSEQLKDSLNEQLLAGKTELRKLGEEKNSFEQENNNLKKHLDGALGDKLQSSHTSSILFIFNVIVALILLIALMWMFVRKKSEHGINENSREGLSEVFDNKFERIEKLGGLRDKGLLTEEEFIFQKKQILGEKN